MTIQDLGSVGELLAAIATIATLIYLARQLRANTAAVRGDSRRAHRSAASAMNRLIASDENVAALFNAGLSDFNGLEPAQRTQFTFFMAELIGIWEQAHQEFEAGVMDEFHVEALGRSYGVFLNTPGGREWWGSVRNMYPPAFRDFVDSRTDSPAQPPPSGPA